MTSITQQKADLKDILARIVMERFDNEDADGQRILAVGLLQRMMASMTLPQLRAWHQGIATTDYVRDQIKQAAPEGGTRCHILSDGSISTDLLILVTQHQS